MASGSAVGAAPVDPLPIRWLWNQLGDGLGGGGLAVADLLGEGTPQLVSTGCFRACWVVQSRFGAELRQEATSIPGETILALAAGIDTDGTPVVVVAREGRLDVYAGLSAIPTDSILIPGIDSRAIALGDIDDDGDVEIVAVDTLDLHVFDLGTGALQTTKFGFGGWSLELGQIDADAALEIAVAPGNGAGWALDGDALTVDWNTPSGFGDLVALGNVRLDAREEILSELPNRFGVRIFDPAGLLQPTDIPNLDNFVGAVAAANVDGSTYEEVLFGDTQWGEIHVASGEMAMELWSVVNPEHGVDAIAAGDFDGDASPEIAWGAGWDSSGPDFLFLADAGSHSIEARSVNLRSPLIAHSIGDVEPDGSPEVIGISQDNSYSSQSKLLRFRGSDGRLVGVQAPPSPSQGFIDDPTALLVGQFDQDASLEICAGIDVFSYRGAIICFDGASGLKEWETLLYEWHQSSAMAAGDVDGDGDLELIVVSTHYLGSNQYVFAFDAQSGAQVWRTPELLAVGQPQLIALCQFDTDPALEIVIAEVQQDVLVIIDGSTGARTIVSSPTATGILCRDPDGNGIDEILAVKSNGTLGRINRTNGVWTVLDTLDPGTYTLLSADLLDHVGEELATIVDSKATILDGGNYNILWQSPQLQRASGYSTELSVGDVDGDGKLELVFGGFGGVVVLGPPYAGTTLLIDGFEGGSLVGWSSAEGL